MTVVVCGRTNLSDRAEAITRHLREEQGFRTDGGCGRAWDLDNLLEHMGVARCVACLRWLCRTACIAAHFAESDHDAMPSVPAAADSRRHGDGAAPAPGILSAESGAQSERPADASSTSDHRTPDRSMQLQGDDDRLVGPNADGICEQWRAGTVPGSMGIGSPGTCPRPTSNDQRKAAQV